MCGIFAYKGNKDASSVLLEGLKNLEYRGYDSAGITVINNKNESYIVKALGKVSNLATKIEKEDKDLSSFHTGIAHTRWATHGGVTLENCHPHVSSNERFYIVHNGIIENYIELKKSLEKKGYKFYGDTDSEVVAKLIEDIFDKDLETTLKKVKEIVTGAYALAVIEKNNPETIVAIKLGSPLVIGFKEKEYFLSSDSNAISNITDHYIPIDDNEMVVINEKGYKIVNSGKEIEKEKIKSVSYDTKEDMGSFRHFMEKEIFEIPNIIENIMGGRINFQTKEIKSNSLDRVDLNSIEKIEIIACGSSSYVGYTGAYLFEDLVGIPTQVTLASEFKYKKQLINNKTLYIFISQSGETADTLESLKIVKNNSGKTFGIVNVVGSSIARLCDNGLYTHCGIEIGVAATKTFIGQLLTILIVALYFGNKKGLEYLKYSKIIEGLERLKDDITMVLVNSGKIEEVAKKYSVYENMFFVGRNLFYPIAMEGSIKCKEISYLHSECYASGELKHGPISLIDEKFPTVLLNPKTELYEKNISTLKEIKARNGKVVGVVTTGDEYEDHYDNIIEVPKTNEYNALFTTTVTLQLFAYYIALNLGREIDKPRNLAKSVTVE